MNVISGFAPSRVSTGTTVTYKERPQTEGPPENGILSRN